jgi:hypothetical protein
LVMGYAAWAWVRSDIYIVLRRFLAFFSNS